MKWTGSNLQHGKSGIDGCCQGFDVLGKVDSQAKVDLSDSFGAIVGDLSYLGLTEEAEGGQRDGL